MFGFLDSAGRRLGRFAILSGFLLCATITSARAGTIHPVLEGALSRCAPNQTIPVWVSFSDRGFGDPAERDAALAAAQERISGRALARRSKVGAGIADEWDLPIAARYREIIARFGVIRHESRWLNALSVEMPCAKIEEAAALPFVETVRPVARGSAMGLGPERAPDGRLLERPDLTRPAIRAKAPLDDPYGRSRWQLEEIGLLQAHVAGYSGGRVLVMMLDTGYRKDHEAFGEVYLLAEHDFVFGDGDTQNEPEDNPTQHWHGTATWSALGGYKPGTIVGPAYGATFLLAKTEDIRSETPIEEDNYVAALEWGDSLGVDVTSASLIYRTFDGGSGWSYEDLDGDTAPISRALDLAAARGILCVNAMGNYGPDPGTLGEPADADSMISCGAVDSTNLIANFSSRGPTADGRIKPEVVARGVGTWSADANGTDTYAAVSGTSLSTPLVGGSCAVVLEAHPEWTAAEVRSALMATADRAATPGNDYGYGRIDVWAAIQSAPVVVPVPFSLVAPARGESVADLRPTFSWHHSTDPQGGAIQYELWIDEDPSFESPLLFSGIADTIHTLSAPLATLTTYYWRVVAEEPDGYRRLCREDRSFATPQASDATDLPGSPGRWVLLASPNPARSVVSLRWYAPVGSLNEGFRLTVLDPAGRRILRERRTVTTIGWNETPWNPRSADGTELPSGVYFALLEAPGYTAGTKIVLTR